MKSERSLRPEEAVKFANLNPEVKEREVVRMYSVSRSALRYWLSDDYHGTSRSSSLKRLNDAEEKAICNYVDRLDQVNLQVRPSFIVDAANAILRERAATYTSPENEAIAKLPSMVGTRWVARFIERHKYGRMTRKTWIRIAKRQRTWRRS